VKLPRNGLYEVHFFYLLPKTVVIAKIAAHSMAAGGAMGLEQVQLRPGMYVGNTSDGTGLDNLVAEVVANAMAEAPPCSRIDVTLYDGDVVAVRDNGAGMPIDTDPEWDVPLAELLVTQLGSGADFKVHPHRSEDLVGVGLPVVNALAEEFAVRIWRGSLEYAMRFYLGAFVHRLQCTGAAGNYKGLPRRGTEIAFIPSPRFFATTRYDFERLEERLRKFEFFQCGVTITLADKRGGGKREVRFDA
jgi:DNA gyrase subunit B